MDYVYFSGLLLLTLVPFHSIILWMVEKSKDIQNKLEVDPTLIRVSGMPFIYGVLAMVPLLKGFFIPYVVEQLFFFDSTFLIISISATFIFHFYSPFTEFKPQPYWYLLLLGTTTFIDIRIGAFTLIVSLLLTILMNSLVLSTLITLFLTFFLTQFFQLQSIYLLSLIIIFCVIFLALNDDAIRYFSKNPNTLYKQFKNR